MQDVQRCSDDAVHLTLLPPPPPPPPSSSMRLTIDEAEPTEAKIRRLISDHPVIIFSRPSCCMCHVMKKLLASIGVNPTVIELDDDEIASLSSVAGDGSLGSIPAPAVFLGEEYIGGLESLVELHLGGRLVPKLVEVGALWG